MSAKIGTFLTLGVLALLGSSLAVLVGVSSASAAVNCATCSAWWHLSSSSLPRNLPPGGEGQISVLAENYGDAGVTGPVTWTDKLPQA